MLLYIIATIATIYAVWNILKLFGVFETSVGISKVVNKVKEDANIGRKRKWEKMKLQTYAALTEAFRGLVMTDVDYENHKYVIDRLELRSKVLNRNLTPEEVKGKYLCFVALAIVCFIFGFFNKLFWAVAIMCMAVYFMYFPTLKQEVRDEDEIIDTYFIDLYLLMYSKLRLGSKARLQVVVESYMDTLQVSSNLQMKEVMLKFARFFLNNLTMYEDHEAIPHLRDRYKSATIVNFCNVAAQALQGVDNRDALLSFKIELTRRKTDMMKKRAENLRMWGERSIYLIYIILFIFIAVGWYSKLPTGLF